MGRLGRAGLIAVVATTSGCAQVFGIDQTTTGGSGDAGSGDGGIAPLAVSLEFERMSIGASVVTAPLDLSAQTAEFLESDPTAGTLTSVAAMFANGGWSAPIAVGAPSVEYTLPDYPTPIERLWAFATRDQKGTFGVLEHPNPQPAPTGATMAISVNLDRAYSSESFQLYTLGSWTDTGLTAPVAAATTLAQSLSFASTGNLTGRPYEALTINDAVLVLRYTGAILDGVLTVAPFAQVAGANPITGTVTTIARDQTLAFSVQPSAPAARFAMTKPAMANTTTTWDLTAAPGYAIGNNSGPQLAAGTILATDSGTISLPYGNPFAGRGWQSTLIYSASASRSFTPTGLPAVSLAAGLYTLVAPTTASMALGLTQGLPQVITIEGTQLAADGMMIGLDPVKAVDITFVSDQTDNTFYQLQVYELVASGTTTVYADRLAASGIDAAFEIPRDVFQVGHTYTLRAICVSGDFPTLTTGNLQNRDLPLSIGYLDSGVFTVTS